MNKDRQVASTTHPITFPLFLSSDHITNSVGTVPSVYVSKDGQPWKNASGAVTEIGSGWYAFAGNSWDRDTLGELAVQATGLGTDRYNDKYFIVPYDPFDGVRLGLTAIPNANAGTTNGLPFVNQLSNPSGIWSYSPRTTTMESGDYAYYADIKFSKNSGSSKDEYTVDWFRNTVPISSGSVTSPLLTVVSREDGTNLINGSGMSYVSTLLGTTKYDELTNRTVAGNTYVAKTTATIDGSTRTWLKLIGRDS